MNHEDGRDPPSIRVPTLHAQGRLRQMDRTAFGATGLSVSNREVDGSGRG
jgi:hypothetical protein